MAFPLGWKHYAPIVIQGAQVSGGAHTNFPVYLDEDCVPGDMLDSDAGTGCNADGSDIRFTTDAAGATQLPVHVVEITQNANPALATLNLWVKVPSITNGVDTTIYIWWGRPSATMPAVDSTYGQYAVWSGFSHRYMLDDDQDATSNNRDLTVANVAYVAAEIDDGMQFDADGGESATFAVPAGVQITSSFDFWLNVDAARATGDCVVQTYWPIKIYIDDPNANKFRIFLEANWTTTDGRWRIDTEYDTGVWYHFQITYDGTAVGNDPVFVVDGAIVAPNEIVTPVGIFQSSTTAGYLGKSSTGNPLHGIVDELGILYGTIRSTDWAITAYNNQGSPGTFAVEGTMVTLIHSSLPVAQSLRAYQLVDPNPAHNLRAFQLVDPLVCFSLRAYQGHGVTPEGSVRAYQGGDAAFIVPEHRYLVKSGYRIVAVDTTTGVETDLGFIAHDASPLTLSGITLANGTYDIQIYLQGYLWHDQRMIDSVRVTVAGGIVSTALPPPVEDLAYTQYGDYTRFIWTWAQTFGCLDPDTFGLWVSTVGPPATAGAPDYTTPAETPRNYDLMHEQGTDTIWVAVASLAGAIRGPESRLALLAPAVALSSPANQRADDDELL